MHLKGWGGGGRQVKSGSVEVNKYFVFSPSRKAERLT
jgi:hypothetical protein